MFAPGLQLIFGSQNYGILGGRKGTSYQLRLMDRKGKVKTTLHTNLATFPLDGAGLIEFSKPGGKPVTVKSGDRIKVMGKWGWTDKVEPLKLSVDVASDTFTVKAKPNAVVHLYLRGTEEFQRVDENGELIFNWWTERSLHVNPRDECEIVYQDKQGNVYFKEVQAF
jgi:hypothetical protein